MGLFDLVTNTVEGVVQTGVNTAKLGVAPVADLIDSDKEDQSHTEDAIDGITEGLSKVGKTDDSIF